MKEIREIIQAYESCKQTGKKCALATVVDVQGSAYRKSGARMLISEDGSLTGAISGGCLEGDAMRKALNVIHQNIPTIVTYDTMDEDDAVIGIGLGCNGIIHVLLEPIEFDLKSNPVEILKYCTQLRQDSVIITLFSLKDRKVTSNGTKLGITKKGIIATPHDLSDNEKSALILTAKQVLAEKKSSWLNIPITEGDTNRFAFCEYLSPSIALIILGAGNDVIPMTQFAQVLGWETTVLDGRANYAIKERFTSACNVLISKSEDVLKHVNVDVRTAFALMTHNYNYDKAVLKYLVKTDTRYVAMLGPKKKLERMLSEYQDEGIDLRQEHINKIFSPAGLDIGSSTPEEIALSVIAEVNAVMCNKSTDSINHKSVLAFS